jgi:hypothetical protein
MANHYQQYSFMIENLTPMEAYWLDKKLDDIDKSKEDGPGVDIDIGSTELEDVHFVYDPPIEDGKEPVAEQIKEHPKSLWLYAEESADLDYLVDFLKDFLKENRPDSYIGFEWANTCSKMRVDEFSGGSVFITADGSCWNRTYDFLETKRKEFEEC